MNKTRKSVIAASIVISAVGLNVADWKQKQPQNEQNRKPTTIVNLRSELIDSEQIFRELNYLQMNPVPMGERAERSLLLRNKVLEKVREFESEISKARTPRELKIIVTEINSFLEEFGAISPSELKRGRPMFNELLEMAKKKGENLVATKFNLLDSLGIHP
ncbi:MAG: hypothetical protein AABX38_00285 [Candidatus Micrarchaeota archaeon]|mgnify:CR=1 FL=1